MAGCTAENLLPKFSVPGNAAKRGQSEARCLGIELNGQVMQRDASLPKTLCICCVPSAL